MEWLVLPLVAALLLASLACAGWARGEALARRSPPRPVPAE
jgi:hypothetical protein